MRFGYIQEHSHRFNTDCANCPMGLQRCYYSEGTTTEVCCNYFLNSFCVVQCPDGFAPNDQFECERRKQKH